MLCTGDPFPGTEACSGTAKTRLLFLSLFLMAGLCVGPGGDNTKCPPFPGIYCISGAVPSACPAVAPQPSESPFVGGCHVITPFHSRGHGGTERVRPLLQGSDISEGGPQNGPLEPCCPIPAPFLGSGGGGLGGGSRVYCEGKKASLPPDLRAPASLQSSSQLNAPMEWLFSTWSWSELPASVQTQERG